jgi:putative ABC transport system permease protein
LPAPGEYELLVGDVLAESLGVSSGDEIKIFDQSFKISGITDYKTALNRGMAYTTLPLLQEQALREGQISMVLLRLDPAISAERRNETIRNISTRFNVTVSETQEVLSTSYNIKVLNAITLAISTVALAMGALTLLGTLLMSVQERIREIGMLAAIGWSAKKIVLLILTEGLIIGVFGCVGGLIAGLAASLLFGSIPAIGDFISFIPSVEDIALPLLLALPLCVAGSALPAMKAVRLAPAVALRAM